ncbi:MAG: DUF349 domain-containing protein [Marinagarivorans sp.]|nr:DUF349 domain-containing protein [Marinagarivorans sp.]
MSFFSRLFKKAPSPVAAVANKPKVEVAVTAPPQGFGPALINDAKNGDGKSKIAACQRLGQLLDSGEITLDQVTAASDNTEQSLQLCSYSYATAAKLLATFSDQHALATLANEAATAQVRKAAAEKVTERSALDAMLKGAKGKDKNVYKIAKTGLAAFKAEDEILNQQRAHLEIIINDAERHAKKPFDEHLYTHKFTSLETEWAEHNAVATAELNARFDAAIAKCQATIDAEIAKARAQTEAKESAQKLRHNLHRAHQDVTLLAAQLYEHSTLSDDDANSLHGHLATLSQQVSEAREALIELNALDTEATLSLQDFAQDKITIETLLHKVQQLGSLQDNLNNLNDDASALQSKQNLAALLAAAKKLPHLQSNTVTTAQTAISQWQAQQNAAQAERKEHISSLNDLSRRAMIAANSGQVGRARGIYRELNEKRAAATDLPQGLSNKLEELDATMSKLDDWHQFAVTPKKEALIDTMTQLQNSSLAPDDLADKIHELQEEWKVLCKGGENQDEALWQAFQTAADIAFTPCKEHFAAQAQLREENAKQRHSLIEHIEQYYAAYNWEKAIWKDVEQTLVVAKEAWKNYWPVPRQQHKDIQAAFDAGLDKIYAKMNEAYDHGRQKKEQLIALAEKAAHHTDPKVAAEDIKTLQNQWKSVGRTYRKTEQQLWTQFRTICDQVFAKRQEIFDELRAEKDQTLQQANELISKVSELAQQAGHQLQSQGSVISEAREAFSQLSEVPKAEYLKFEKTLKSIEQKIAHYRSQNQQQIWLDLFTLNSELHQNEQTPLDEATRELLMTKIDEQKLPAQCADILKARIQSTESFNEQQTLNALKLLCIRAEILAGKESPAADKNLRMQHQVKALQENFGAAQTDTQEQLAREWISHGGCPTKDLVALQQRFLNSTFSPQAELELA